jgi:RNase P protein component
MHGGHDYVLIGRRAALAVPFGQMRQELDTALGRIHDPERNTLQSRDESRRATGGGRDRSLHQQSSPRPAKRQPRRKPHEH